MSPLIRLLLLLSWPVALGLAAWVVSRLPFDALLQSISGLSVAQWLGWILLNILIVALLAWRWLLLTRAISLPLGFLQLLRIRQAGQLVSFVTPGPQFGGEPLQVYWLWARYGSPGPQAFLAVGLDRFFELWINFAVLLLAVLILLTSAAADFVDWQAIAATLTGLIMTMGIGGWILLRQPASIRNGIKQLIGRWLHLSRLQQLDTHWTQLNESLQSVVATGRRALAAALALSLLAWTGMIVEFCLLLDFVGVPLDPTSIIFLFTLVRLAFLLPLPGGVGSVEAALFWGFQALALPLPAAAGLIALMRLRDVVILLSGVVVLPGLRARAPAMGTQ